MSEEEILKYYKLSEEEHEKYYQIIKRVFTSNKIPEKDPIAVIIGGQTGAGKSSIIGYSTRMFPNENVVIINSDEIKPFHPKQEEIAKKYPELYTKITDQESNTWTSRLFTELRQEGYNIIFEGTMKNNRVADESIEELKKLGYTVIVRGLAVCNLESRMSIIERYIAQLKVRGFGRLVVPEHHNQTYNGMPNTIEYIEQTGKYDILEIFERGEDIESPTGIYAMHNPSSKQKTSKAIKGKLYVSKYSKTYGYKNAKDAILSSREEQIDFTISSLKERMRRLKEEINNMQIDTNVRKMILDFMHEYEELINTRNEDINR